MAISYANVQVTKVLTLRGNTIQNNRYTGLPGELTVDTEAKTIRIHDGVTPGGNVVQGGGSLGSYGNANVKVYLTAFDGNIVPSANVTYSLGSPTRQWKDLFVSNSTIYVGGVPLSIDATGNLTVNGNVIPTIDYINAEVANVTVDLSAYALNANVTAANVGIKGYVDQANTIQSAQVGAANLAIISANVGMKGYIDSQSFYSNTKVADYLPTYSGDIAANISKAGKTWTFDSYGNITLPGGATLGVTTTNTAILTAATSNTIDIQSSNRYNKVQVDDTMVSIMAGDSHWHYDYYGRLTLPSGANITSYGAGVTTILDDNGVIIAQRNGVNAFSVTSSTGVRILSGGNPWQFYSDGSSTFPGNLTVAGNLTVNGNVTYISVNNVVIGDNIINLADLNPADSLDLGFVAHRTPSGQPMQHTGLVRDASANQWRLFSNVVPAPGTTVDFTNAIYDDLQLGNVIGNITGSTGYITNFDSFNVTVENIYARVASNGVNIGAGGNNNLLVLPTDVLIQNVPLTVAGNIIANEFTGLSITANLPVGGTAQIWNFGSDGRLAFPGTPVIDTDANNFDVIGAESVSLEANAVVNIYTDTGGSAYQWQFGNDGNLTFPDNTAQTTAFPGFNGYATNANVTAANVGMKGYVDSLTYSNVQTAAYLTTNNYLTSATANLSLYAWNGNASGGGTSYSNVNVAAYLATATINTTGNITAQNLIGNISITGNVTGTSANVTLQAGAYTSVFDNQGNVRLPTAYVTGNVSANYFVGNGALLTGIVAGSNYSNVQVATYLPTYSGNVANLTVTNTLRLTATKIALGYLSGLGGAGQGTNSVAVGSYSGYNTQGNSAVAIGVNAGMTQGDDTVAIGSNAGGSQTTQAVAVGFGAGQSSQSLGAVALGYASGQSAQGLRAVAIGSVAGNDNQGAQSIAIGHNAGYSFQPANSIELNATGSPLNYANLTAGLYITSVKNDTANVTNVMYYNTTTNEVTYGPASGGGSYSNVQVATYLPTYTGNIANIRLGVAGVLTFADSTLQTTAWSGTVSGGSVSGNVAEATLAYAVNISPVLLNQEYSMAILPSGTGAYGVKSSDGTIAFTFNPTRNRMVVGNIQIGASGNITFADGTVLTTAAAAGGGNYSNVNVAVYLPTYGGTIQSSNVQTTSANIQATTAATNTATGALRVAGGIGVAGTVVAGHLNSTGNVLANAISAYSLNTVANVTASVVNAGTINSAGNVLAQNLIGTIATASQTNITAVGTLGALTVTGNATVGNLIGTEANTRIIANVYTTTFDIYGNVSFPGNVNVGGLGITMPTRPAFRVIGNGGQITAIANITSSNWTLDYQQGNNLVTSTGVFTAPIAGLYSVHLVVRTATNNNLTINQAAVLQNNSNVLCMVEFGSNTSMNHTGVSTIARLAVGDTLTAKVLVGTISFDGNDNYSVAYIG